MSSPMTGPVPEAPLLGKLDRDPEMVARHADPDTLGGVWYFLSPVPGMGEPVLPGRRSGVVAVHPAMKDTIGRMRTEGWVRVVSPEDHTAMPWQTPPSASVGTLPVAPTGHPQQADVSAQMAQLQQMVAQLAAANAGLSAQVQQLLAREQTAQQPATPAPEQQTEAERAQVRNSEAREQFKASKHT